MTPPIVIVIKPVRKPEIIDVENIDSAVLRRLIREVKNNKKSGGPRSFDRIHNRHNRS